MDYLVYTLLGMWSVGCIGGALYWAISNILTPYDRAVGFMVLFTGLPIAAFMGLLPWAVLADMQSPDLATLKKGEWTCSQTRIVNGMMPVVSGKTTTMVPTTSTECIQYSRL